MTLALAACVPGDRVVESAIEQQVPTQPADTVESPDDTPRETLPEAAPGNTATALAPNVASPPSPTPVDALPSQPQDPPLLARQRAACAAADGQLMPRGNGFFACVRQTQDAGRSCDASTDCEGQCLARSGTCAPLHPLFGCHEVFTLPGRRETLCTD